MISKNKKKMLPVFLLVGVISCLSIIAAINIFTAEPNHLTEEEKAHLPDVEPISWPVAFASISIVGTVIYILRRKRNESKR